MSKDLLKRIEKLERITNVNRDLVLFADDATLMLEGLHHHLRFRSIEEMNAYIDDLDVVVVLWNGNEISW